MSQDQLLEFLGNEFVKLGAPADVHYDLQAYRRQFLHIYDKFSMWAYDGTTTALNTNFRVQSIRKRDDGSLEADVFLNGAGLDVRAAVVAYHP